MCRQTDVPKDVVPTGRFAERRFADNVRTMCRQNVAIIIKKFLRNYFELVTRML